MVVLVQLKLFLKVIWQNLYCLKKKKYLTLEKNAGLVRVKYGKAGPPEISDATNMQKKI